MATSTVRLGWKPIPCIVQLSAGSGWNCTIEPSDPPAPQPDYPVGTTVVAKIYPADTDVSTPIEDWTELASWDATVTTDTITFAIAKSETAPIPEGSLARIFLTEPGIPPYQYLSGKVDRID